MSKKAASGSMSRRAGFMSCCNFFFLFPDERFFSITSTDSCDFFFFSNCQVNPQQYVRSEAFGRRTAVKSNAAKWKILFTAAAQHGIASARLLSSKTRAAFFSSLFGCKEDVKHSFALWAACTFGFQMAGVISRALIASAKTVKLV